MWSCAGVLALAACACALSRDQLYPHGAGLDQRLPRGNEVVSPEITLNTPVFFYGQSYESIFVSNYGVLTFRADISSFINTEFPLPYASIAAFYSNIDTTTSGSVFYRETNESHVLLKAEESVQNNFHDYFDFKPASVFVATWENVSYSNPQSEKVNTFQVAIISNGTESFVELLYPQRDIQWIQRESKSGELPDAKAQAGFISEDGTMLTLRGSGSHQIRNIAAWSNVQDPGRYLFRVGQVSAESNIAVPDLYNEYDVELEEESRTCAQSGPSMCHTNARCVDYDNGTCCQCQEDFYGNGKSCIRVDVPLRVHGKLNGQINNINIDDINMQSYVVVADGRTYTALSQANLQLGPSLQFLNILGGVIGWLFAKPTHTVKNGYQLTGSLFNHSADIFFPATGERVTIQQEFLGHDVFDQISVNSDIRGSLPFVPAGNKLEMKEYDEQYSFIESGILKSESTKTYVDKVTGLVYEQRVSQTITYNPCRAAPLTEQSLSPFSLKVLKNYLEYENKTNIVRYGMSNKVTPLGQEDPCVQGKNQCGAHSTCVVLEDTFTCVCLNGFSKEFDSCVDIDECAVSTHNCDANADCYNFEGSFSCRCRDGFEGNGMTCVSSSPCRSCDRNAQCENVGQGPVCVCNSGYTGDGRTCAPYDSSGICASCSPNAYCSQLNYDSAYTCICNAGYSGNGFSCVQDLPTWTTPIYTSPNTEADYNETFFLPNCDQYSCSCPDGYETFKDERNNNLCRRIQYPENDTSIKCTTEEDCPTNAICNSYFDQNTDQYIGYCVCPEGYQIDANECIEKTSIEGTACACGPNGYCVDTVDGESMCICAKGYKGDGYNCRPNSVCINNSNCESHAECRPDPANYDIYVCQCIEGYIKDQNDACISDVQLCNGAVCADHATCLFDETDNINYCHCDTGYEGDAISNCSPKDLTCYELNDCHPDAVCTPYESTYQCVCREGYIGNGYNCSIEENCRSNPNLCDLHASCIKTSDGFECACNSGYTNKDGYCELNPRQSGNFLVASDGASVYRVPFQVTPRNFATPLNSAVYQIAVGIDVDCENGKIYWGDVVGGAIKRASYDGSGFEIFLTNDVKAPEGIAIDWSGRNIFWTDSKKLTIEVANLDTRQRAVLFEKDGITNPRGIAVHPERGKVFWSDWYRAGPKIEWANMDGSDRRVFLDHNSVKLPNALSIDWERDRLCYTDAGRFVIECVQIDTLQRYTIATDCPYPFGLAIRENTFYWTDWKTLKIEYVDQSTSARGQVPIATASRRLYGVATAPSQCPRVSPNICTERRGLCGYSDLCLPTGRNGYSCVPAQDNYRL